MNRFFLQLEKADSTVNSISYSLKKKLSVGIRNFIFSISPKILQQLLLWFALFLCTGISTNAQVQFKIELLNDQATYRVSLLPSVTWTAPQNITSTAQVTFKTPTGGFVVGNVQSLNPGSFWANNASYQSPPEAVGSDYYSFGLTSLGTSSISYEAGVETPLFTFQNIGTCTGPVEIVQTNDPFLPPNSQNANISNNLTTLGGGAGNNVFSGIYDVGNANCLNNAGCIVQFEIDQVGGGEYIVSINSDTAWNTPLNITDTLITTVIAPTGTLSPSDIQGVQSGTSFDVVGSLIAPTQNPGFDYFVFAMTSGATSNISYQYNLKLPIFSFANNGNCEGDSLMLMNMDTDPLVGSSILPFLGHYVKTVGSVAIMEGCSSTDKVPMMPEIGNVEVTDLTDCGSNNGIITIQTESFADLEYSIDGGNTWQNANTFTSLTDGFYDVAIRYEGGTCAITYNQNPVEITAPPIPVYFGANVNNPTACGAANGSIFVNASPNISQEYSIDGGVTWQQSPQFSNLSVGTYIIKVRNGNLTCEVPGETVSLVFNGATSPVINSVTTNAVSSCLAANGTIFINASDNANLEYSIDNGVTWSPNANFVDLEEGIYQIQIRNEGTQCITVYENNPVVISNTQDCNNCLAEYEIELLVDGRYQVSVIPDTTWTFPNNITSTAQVTIAVPTGGFQVSDLTNLIPGVVFNNNSRQNAPLENPDEDYISFGLETLGTTNISYQTGVKVPLFTFRNDGFCSGGNIRLIEEDDPFAFPNSQLVNVGQQLSTIGSGQDGLVCVKFPGFTPCIPQVEAVNDFYNVYVNSTLVENVIVNDTNFLNNGLNAFYVAGSTTNFGTVVLEQNGTITYTPNTDFVGLDTMLYQVCGDAFSTTCDVGMITFNVKAANLLEAFDDVFTTNINTTINGNVSFNDVNPDDNGLHYTLSQSTSNGVIQLNVDGTFTYTPNIGFIGFDQFVYEVCDDGFPTVCDFATVTIQVKDSNVLLAVADSYIGTLNTVISGNVSLNDFNPNGGSITVNLIAGQGVTNGALVLNTDGTFDYTPNTGFAGFDGFSYEICNNAVPQECDTTTVTLNIFTGINAIDDQFTLDVNTTFTSNVWNNDILNTGLINTTTLISTVGNGSLTINANGSFTYVPNAGFTGTDQFTYEVCDNAQPQNCDVATVFLTVLPMLNAVDDNFVVAPNANFNGNVLPNDSWSTGVSISASLVSNPNNGMIAFSPDGSFVYFPNAGFVGTDSFLYQICDMANPPNCDTAVVYLTVPSGLMALDDDFGVIANTPFQGTVIPNDNIPIGVTTTATNIINPLNGSLFLQGDGTFTYIPDNGFVGIDSFFYRLCGNASPFPCDTAKVTLNVIPQLIAEDDTYNINVNTVLSSSVLPNDTFDPNIPIEVTPTTNPSNGMVTVLPNGDFSYVPNTDFVGTDQFDYEICYTNATPVCESATVFITIEATVIATDDFVNGFSDTPVTGSVLNNDFIVGVPTTTLVPNTGPANGTLTLNPDGSYEYIPFPGFEGTDGFDYVVCNDAVPAICDTASVLINIGLFITANDDYFTTPANTPLDGDIILNDSSPNGIDVEAMLIPGSGPFHGVVSFNPDGSFIYTPSFNYQGNEVLQYELCTVQTPVGCDTAFVFILIGDNPVVANPDSLGTPLNTPVTGDVIENDNFPSGSTTTVTLVPGNGPNGGTVTINPDGTFEYLPNPGFEGDDTFDYELCDNNTPPNCDTTTVTITIGIPVMTANDDVFAGSNNTPIGGNVLVNDENPNNSDWTVTTTPLNGPNGGDVILNDDGTFIYTPIPGFTGVDQFDYEVCDNETPITCDTATVTINVNNGNGGGSSLSTPEIICPDEICGVDMLQFSLNQFYTGNSVEYEWINADGDVIGDDLSLNIMSNDPMAVQPFRVRVTVDGETSEYSDACFVPQATVPVLSVTATTPMVCQGTEVALVATPMSNLSYEWRLAGSTTVLSTLPNPTFTAQTTATYELTVTQIDCADATATYNVLVETMAAPDFDPVADYNMTQDCVPGPLSFDPNINGSTDNLSFVWEGPNGFYSNEPAPILANVGSVNNGLYTVTITNNAGCSTVRTLGINDILDFIPEPIITYSGPVCLGEEVELITQYYAGFDVDYTWMKNGQIASANSSNQLIVQPFSIADTGMYQVMVKVDQCEHESDLFDIEILEMPEVAPDFNLSQPCEGGILNLNSNTLAGGVNATYEWIGPNGFFSEAPNTIVTDATVENNGTYTLNITAENGCTSSATIDVLDIVEIPDTPQAIGNGPICEEGQLVVTVQNPASGNDIQYTWRNGDGAVVGDESILTLDATDPLLVSPFVLQVNVDGCSSDLSNPVTVEVSNPATPALEVNEDFLCEGDALLLNATLYSGQNTSYAWYFDNGITTIPLAVSASSTFIIQDADASNSGTYFVVAQVDGCQTDTSNIQLVEVFSASTPPLTTNSTELEPACSGDDVQLNIPLIPGATYEWFGPNGFTANGINPVLPDAQSNQSGGYFAVVSFNGCSLVSDTTFVEVTPQLATPFLLANNGQNSVCEGGELTLQVQNPAPGVSYEYYHVNTGTRIDSTDNTSITIPNISSINSGEYFVVAIQNGCRSLDSQSIPITVSATPANVALAGADQTLCSDIAEFELNATNPTQGTGTWTVLNTGVVVNPNDPQSIVMDLEEGINQFVWSLSTDACGVYSTDTVEIATAFIDAVDDSFSSFVNDTMPPVNLLLNDGGLAGGFAFDLATLPNKGEILVLDNGIISYFAYPDATGTDEFSYLICSEECPEVCDMATVNITLVGSNPNVDFYVPNTITPNDDGINDEFLIPAAFQFPGSELSIFNRLGDQVFFIEDYQNDWRGTYKEDPLPVGTYFYCLRLNDGKDTVLNGYVVIRR